MKKLPFSAMLLSGMIYAGCGSSNNETAADSTVTDTTTEMTTQPTDTAAIDGTAQTENPTATGGTPGDNKKGNTNP